MFISSSRLRSRQAMPAPRLRSRKFRPLLEGLEDRLTPAVKTWVGGAFVNVCTNETSGSPTAWDNPRNWIDGVPGAGDAARFADTFQVTTCAGNPVFGPFNRNPVVNVPTSLSGVTMENGWNGALSVNEPLSLTGASDWVTGSIGGDDTLTNSGTLTISGDAAKSLSIVMNNAGTILHTGAGSMNFNSGTLNNQASALYEFRGTGGFHWASGSRLATNAGTIRKAGDAGTVDVNVLFNNAAGGVLDVQAGTLRLIGGGTSTGGTYGVAAGATLDLTAGSAHVYSGNYTSPPSGSGTILLANGTLTSSGATFNFSAGLFQWTGGTINGTTLTNTGTVTLAGTAAKSLSSVTLNNSGTIVHTGSGNLNFNSATLANLTGGVYDFQDTGTLLWASGSRLTTNAGTVRKSAGDPTTFAMFFNNLAGGVIDVAAGRTLVLGGGGANEAGDYRVATGGVLDLTGGGGTAFTGTYTGSGAGTVQLSSGTLTANGATFNFPAELFRWIGGTINGAGLTNAGSLTLAGAAGKSLSSTTLSNAGIINHTDTGDLSFNSANLEILAAGTYDLQSNAGLIWSSGGPNIVNAGTFIKSAGAGTSALTPALANTGALFVLSGMLALSGRAATFSNNGLAFAASGALTVSGTYVQAEGSLTYLAAATLAAPTITLAEGSLFLGAGTINGHVTNAGLLFVGDPAAAGTLTITGNYTQTAVGIILMELGNFGANEFDVLNISGTASLQGLIFVDVLPSFVPNAGDNFTVLTFGSRGPGDPLVLVPDIGPNLLLDPVFGAASLTLQTRQP